MLESKTTVTLSYLRFFRLASHLANESRDIFFGVAGRRKCFAECVEFSVDYLKLVGAEGFAEEFADVAALFAGGFFDLFGEVFWEADGEDAGVAGAWGSHGLSMTE
jgi:hypothetical protein